MNSLAYNDSNNINAIEMEHKESTASERNYSPSESQQRSCNDEYHHSDVSTPCYIRGYN